MPLKEKFLVSYHDLGLHGALCRFVKPLLTHECSDSPLKITDDTTDDKITFGQ